MQTLLLRRDDNVATLTFNRPEKKNAINQVMWRELIEALEIEHLAQAANIGSKDTAEAMTAFLERRDPRFTGE